TSLCRCPGSLVRPSEQRRARRSVPAGGDPAELTRVAVLVILGSDMRTARQPCQPTHGVALASAEPSPVYFVGVRERWSAFVCYLFSSLSLRFARWLRSERRS